MRPDLSKIDKTPREIDRTELLVVLNRIYTKTSNCWTKLNIRNTISTSNTPSVKAKCYAVVFALVSQRILLRKGTNGHSYQYIWNDNIGQPTLKMCEELILHIKDECRKSWRNKWANKVKKAKEMERMGIEKLDN